MYNYVNWENTVDLLLIQIILTSFWTFQFESWNLSIGLLSFALTEFEHKIWQITFVKSWIMEWIHSNLKWNQQWMISYFPSKLSNFAIKCVPACCLVTMINIKWMMCYSAWNFKGNFVNNMDIEKLLILLRTKIWY